MKITSTLLGSALAFLLATSCCWLPWLVVAIGGSVLGVSAFSARLEALSTPLMFAGAGLLGYAGFSFWQKNRGTAEKPAVILQSLITCPTCGFAKTETMPIDACQFFYACEQCHTLLKPLAGDCCVFCSYGTVPCPPMQAGDKDCC